MKAVILAGGRGTRLSPHTMVLPKPLIPIGDMPILEILLRKLIAYGFTEAVICIGYHGNLIKTYFGDGSNLGISLSYSEESKPLGTAGPIGLIPNLGSTFFVMNGDILSDVDLAKMLNFHRKNGKIATVGIVKKTVNVDLGVITTRENYSISNYIEKPSYTFKVSMGVYVFESRIVNEIQIGEYLDLPQLILNLISKGDSPMAYEQNCNWLDMGRIEDYSIAFDRFQRDRALYLPETVQERVT